MKCFYFIGIIIMISCSSNQTSGVDMMLDGYKVSKIDNETELAQKINTEGIIEEEGMVFSKKKTGAWVVYQTNPRDRGKVKSITNYLKGKKNGIYLRFTNSGRMELKEFYVGGLLEGERVLYGLNKVKEIANFKNGKLSGVFKTFYDNGKLQQESNFLNGQKEGSAKYFDMEGNLKMEYEYKNGKAVQK